MREEDETVHGIKYIQHRARSLGAKGLGMAEERPYETKASASPNASQLYVGEMTLRSSSDSSVRTPHNPARLASVITEQKSCDSILGSQNSQILVKITKKQQREGEDYGHKESAPKLNHDNK